VQLGIQPGGVWLSHNLTHPAARRRRCTCSG
jgi:hypothetical protein